MSISPKIKYNGASVLIPSFLLATLGDLWSLRSETLTSSMNFDLHENGDYALFILASLEASLVPGT